MIFLQGFADDMKQSYFSVQIPEVSYEQTESTRILERHHLLQFFTTITFQYRTSYVGFFRFMLRCWFVSSKDNEFLGFLWKNKSDYIWGIDGSQWEFWMDVRM